MSIKTCRIMVRQIENKTMGECLDIQLQKVGLTIEDISVNAGKHGDDDNNSHFGNWCFVPCLDLPQLYNDDFLPDMQGFVLEQSDIDCLKVGDKVKIQYTNSWAVQNTEQGSVYNFRYDENNKINQVTILKKGSKSKGWNFRPGESCMIEKLEKWSK